MKWSEFKEQVETELDKEDPEMAYIDINYPDEIQIGIDDEGLKIL